MQSRLARARTRLANVLSRRPLAVSLAAALLVALVSVTLLWQVRLPAHAANQVSGSAVSDAGDPFTDTHANTGSAVYTYNNYGCTALDANNFCTAGAWTNDHIAGAHWIWETQVTQESQGNDPVTFGKTITLPATATNITASIQIAADNAFDLKVNGAEAGSGSDWTTVYSLPITLNAGSNTLAVAVANQGTFDAFGNPAGLAYRVDYSYSVDSTPPSTTAYLVGQAGSNGWYRGPVTLTLQASDPDDDASALTTYYSTDGLTFSHYTAPVSITDDGQYTVLFYSSDPAGNVEPLQRATINLDQTAPTLNVTGAASGNYSICAGTAPTRPTFAPTDNLSGLDGTQSDSWTTSPSATGAGNYTYTAQARDNAGNAAQETRSYTVAYGPAFSGVLFPGTSDTWHTFKLGSTIPVVFQLKCNGTPITNAVASLMVSQNGKAQGKAIPAFGLNKGNAFTYESIGRGYLFTLSTKNGYLNADGSTSAYTAGTWTLSVVLDDGSSHDVTITLR